MLSFSGWRSFPSAMPPCTQSILPDYRFSVTSRLWRGSRRLAWALDTLIAQNRHTFTLLERSEYGGTATSSPTKTRRPSLLNVPITEFSRSTLGWLVRYVPIQELT